MHDLHATMLHLLGIDHERLTYRYQGRDFRLTDVAGVVRASCWRESSAEYRAGERGTVPVQFITCTARGRAGNELHRHRTHSPAPYSLATLSPAMNPLLLLALVPQVTPNTLSSLERQAGWELAFDGETLDGWHAFGRGDAPQPEGGWEVLNGCLHLPAGRKGGDLVTDHSFGDFELELEWRVAPGANSGIKYRVAEPEGAVAMLGPEYQVLDDERHPDAGKGITAAASLYALYAPEGKHPVARRRVQPHPHRGARRSDRALAQRGARAGVRPSAAPTGSERRTASKFAPFADSLAAAASIGLQDHGDEVWYRSIRVRDLPRTSRARPVELFDGRR